MRPRIRIVDNQFSHCGNGNGSFGTGDLGIAPTFFDWHRGEQINDLVVITENCFHLVEQQNEKTKIALIIEPPSINSSSYEWIKQNYSKFTYVLSHNSELLDSIPNGVYYMFGGCWILPQQQDVYEKTKNVSIIASDKKSTVGQILRHSVIESFGDVIDGVYGRGYVPVDNKISALKDYRYSIVIENENSETWITEKLIDCFATGTVPIYWGTRKAADYFDDDGIIFFDTTNELHGMSNLIGIDDYKSRLRAIEKNFHLCKGFQIPEDRIFLTVLSHLLLK